MPSNRETDFQAWFFDGQTAAKQKAVITLTAQGIAIEGAEEAEEGGGGWFGLWTYGDLTATKRIRPGQPVQLASKGNPDARLMVDDPAFSERLGRFAPHLSRHVLGQGRTWVQAGLAAGLLVLVGVLAVYGIPRLSGPIAAVIPVSWEVEIGKAAKANITGSAKACGAPSGRAALEVLTRRLAGQIDTEYVFDVTIADSPVNNAFAVPGGHIIVMRGLLDTLESPEELAGVLAHEMGHVTERHPLAGAIRLTGISLLLDLIVGGDSNIVDALVNLGGALIAFSYSREDERTADAIALRILRKAAISPKGLERFFERLTAGAGIKVEVGGDKVNKAVERAVTLFSTHPWSDERLQEVRKAPAGEVRPALIDAQWLALKGICG
jgi:Zn-dependent protease with chaperone function